LLERKTTFTLIAILIVLFGAIGFTYFYLSAKINAAIHQQPIIITENERRIYTPPIPDELDFCGEKVPMEDFDVRERIEREFLVNTYWHSASLLYLKRANRWFPIIEPILKKNGIPDDFKGKELVSFKEMDVSKLQSPNYVSIRDISKHVGGKVE